jgi:hypothetical protein
MNPRTRAPRAYLLIEISVGGALIAVLITGLLTQLAAARVQNVIAGRDVISAQLAQEKIEIERASGFKLVPGCAPAETSTVLAGQQGQYRRTCSRGGPLGETIGGVAVRFNEVTVVVEYETNTARNGGLRRIEAITRVYER